MDNYISKDTFLRYLDARLRNAKKGADSKGIASHYAADAKSFRDECHLIPQLVYCVVNDFDCRVTPYKAIWQIYYYWHCILMEYCWNTQYIDDGFFHRMARYIYTYRDELLKELVS